MIQTIQEFNPTIFYAFDTWNQPDNENEKHHHDFLELTILLEGEAYYWFDKKWQVVRAGDILLFNPFIEHGEKQLKQTYSHQLHIGIGQFSLDGLENNTFPKTPILLSGQKNQMQVFDKAWQLLNQFNQAKPTFNLICKGLIFEIMGLLLEGFQLEEEKKELVHSKNDRLNQAVQFIISYMETNYSKDLTIDQLATMYFVSPTYLSKIFKEITGVAPITYLIQIRLKHAYRLLQQTDEPIKEIAQAVGYDDAYHFSKSFKKQYGSSPSKIRKEIENKK